MVTPANAANQHHFAVADASTSASTASSERSSSATGASLGDADRRLIATQIGFVAEQFPSPDRPARRRTLPPAGSRSLSLFDGCSMAVTVAWPVASKLQTVQPCWAFGLPRSMASGLVPMYRRACRFQRARQLRDESVPPYCDSAFRLLDAHDFQRLQRRRLEIADGRSVVVGGAVSGFTVDRNGLITVFAQRQRGIWTQRSQTRCHGPIRFGARRRDMILSRSTDGFASHSSS